MNTPIVSINEVVSTRIFPAPRERVFQAFADKTQLAKWWGPTGFTNTINEFDFKPSGYWRFVMHSPDGKDFKNVSRFIEIFPNERIAFQHLEPLHRFKMTMTFVETAGKTQLTWIMRFETREEFERVHLFVAEANQQNFDRLANLLKSPS